MGLFVSAQDQKAKKAFQAIAPSRTSVWMPGGVSQARQLIRALTEVLEWDPDSTETEDMGHLLTLFMETCEALQSCNSPFEIKKRLQAVPMLEEAPLYGFLAVCQEFYKDSAASWKDEETRQNVSEAQQELEDEDGWIRYNSEKANAHFRSDETGLNVHMPIYTIGTQGEQNYLNTLETADGRKLNWERINSYVVDPKGGSVDEFIAILDSGEEYGRIFLNIYCDRTSVVVPKGYRINLS